MIDKRLALSRQIRKEAVTGRRVVLVELDLRRPTFARQLDLDGSVGLTNVLTGGDSAADLLVEPFPDVPRRRAPGREARGSFLQRLESGRQSFRRTAAMKFAGRGRDR